MLGKDIRNLVLVKLEEYTPYGPDSGRALLAGGDKLDEKKPIYSYIAQHLAEVANEVLLVAPVHRLLYKAVGVTGTPDADDNRIGSISLPDDFLRIHTLWMQGWRRPVHETIKAGHPLYNLQFSPWKRGTKQKPVAVLCGRGNIHKETNAEQGEHLVFDEQQTIRYFSVDAGTEHPVKEFKYIPKFDGEYDYEREVAELIALQCARKVCEVFGMTEQIGIMTSEFNSVLENIRL